jgi:ferredoxin
MPTFTVSTEGRSAIEYGTLAIEFSDLKNDRYREAIDGCPVL